MDQQKKIAILWKRIEELSLSVKACEQEINALRQEIAALQSTLVEIPAEPNQAKVTVPIIPIHPIDFSPAVDPAKANEYPSETTKKAPRKNLEEYIGGNLVNKVGILILVLGVGVFLKYAIDSDWLGPLSRISLGYGIGIGLIGLAYRLKKQYRAYSAVLLSGGVATLYFSTYLAYDFYQLLPLWLTFLLMVGITVFTVYAATLFNQQVIGVIGLAGAYAVPILLSSGSGRVEVLFTYMTIINLGIATVAFRKSWKLMNLLSFALTWLIFTGWFIFSYEQALHLPIAFLFNGVFFIVFYAIFLFYQLSLPSLQKSNLVAILVNTVLMYAVGFSILHEYQAGKFTGLFTISVAVIHLLVGIYVYRKSKVFSHLLSLAIGLGIAFVTLAIPVQLGGSWTTLLWAVEAVVLFWIGRKKSLLFYEQLAFITIGLSIISLFAEWYPHYSLQVPEKGFPFLINRYFALSLWVNASLATMWFIEVRNKTSVEKNTVALSKILPVLVISFTYLSFFLEISYFFNAHYIGTHIYRWEELKNLWLLAFTAFYLAVLGFAAIFYFRQQSWLNALGILNVLLIGYWCLYGLRELSTLLNLYFAPSQTTQSTGYIVIRYVCYTSIAAAIIVFSRLLNQPFSSVNKFHTKLQPLLVHLFILSVLSSELVLITLFFSPPQSLLANKMAIQKVGFSVLWGVYSFLLIATGIWRKRKVLRLMGIGLLAVTLGKLFLLDLNNISTLGKIIAFMGLGVLLLVISFLYQKFKDVILAEDS